MIRVPPKTTPPDTLCPYTTLFRSTAYRSGRASSETRCTRIGERLSADKRPMARRNAAFAYSDNRTKIGSSLSDRIALAASTMPAQFADRSEEHTSELQSLMRNSYAVFCFKTKK